MPPARAIAGSIHLGTILVLFIFHIVVQAGLSSRMPGQYRFAQFTLKRGLTCDVLAAPVSVIATTYVAVEVLVGTYRTVIVQLLPGLTTAPDTQVPPVIEKVPVPALGSFVNVGAEVSVSGPAFAPVAVLVTVIVAFFVVVLAGVVVITGLGAVIETVAPTTLNATVLLVPPGVVTAMFLTPSVAAFAIFRRAVTLVEVEVRLPVTRVTPPVSPVRAVAPARLLPLSVIRRLVLPRDPVVGVIEVRVGVGTSTPVNSIAPASTDPFVFLAVPKKSTAGARVKAAPAEDGMRLITDELPVGAKLPSVAPVIG